MHEKGSPAPTRLEPGTLTVVYVDQVGSTEQLVRLGDDAAKVIRVRLLDRLASIVEAAGGSVSDFTGDGLMALFSASTAALDACEQMLSLTAGDPDHSCDVRIGVHTGELERDPSDRWHGLAIVVAARLCAAAAPKTALVSHLTQVLVSTKRRHAFDALQEFELKGVPDATAASNLSVSVAARPDSRPTLAGFFTMPHRVGFCGRRVQRAALADDVAKAAAGNRTVHLVGGEPGAGKTRLVTEACLEAMEQGFVAVAGICTEDADVPYEPFIELIPQLLSVFDPDDRARLFAGCHPEIGLIVPDAPVSGRISEDGALARQRSFDSMVALLRTITAERPVVIVLDDLQWATSGTLALVRHLVRNSHDLHLCVLVTYRTTELDSSAPLRQLLADLHRVEGVRRTRLDGLGDDEAVELAEEAAGHALGPEHLALAHRLRDETGGSPYLFLEMLVHLVDSGAVVEHRGVWHIADHLELPESVRDVIDRRVGRLPDEAQDMLRIAAVIGRRADPWLVARVAESSEDAVIDALDRAVAAGLLREDAATGQYVFSHALTHDAVYQSGSAPRRARLHHRIAGVLEDAPRFVHASAAEVAHHWYHATRATEGDRLVAALARAAREALAARDFEQAEIHCLRALEVTAGSPELRSEHIDVLVLLGEARRWTGGDHRSLLLQAARLAIDACDPLRAAGALSEVSRPGMFFHDATRVDHELITMMREVLPMLPVDEHPLRARLLVSLAVEQHWIDGAFDERRDLARRGVEAARAAGDPILLADVLQGACVALGDPISTEQRRVWADELCELAALTGRLEDEFTGRFYGACARIELGDSQSLADLAVCRNLADDIGAPFLQWMARLADACVAAAMDPAAGEAAAVSAYEIAEASAQTEAFEALSIQLSTVCSLQGRIGDLIDTYAELVAARPDVGLITGYVRLLLELDRFDDARAALADLLERETWVGYDMLTIGAYLDLAEVAAILGTDEQRRRVLQVVEPFRDRMAVVLWFLNIWGCLARHVGYLKASLGRIDEAIADFEFALEREESFGFVAVTVTTRRHLADALERRGWPSDRERVEELRRRALDDGRRLRMAREVRLLELGTSVSQAKE